MRFYDAATALQFMTEGVKLHQSQVAAGLISSLKTSVLSALASNYSSELGKGKLNELLSSIRVEQVKAYSAYTENVISNLKKFSSVAASANRKVFATLIQDEEAEELLSEEESEQIQSERKDELDLFPIFGIAAALSNSKIWTAVLNSPSSATGIYIEPFVKGFGISAMASTDNEIRRSWANGATSTELNDSIISVFDRIFRQSDSVISTVVQQVGVTSGVAVNSSLFSHYLWISIMDNRTTNVCRSRHGLKFKFGGGPLPPAHINCRSHITPVSSDFTPPAETLYDWLQRQPREFQNDLMGRNDAVSFRKGEFRSMSIEEFNSLVGKILNR